MNKTIIQVPVSTDLRDQASAIVQDEWGLSSLQEALRHYMKQIVNRTVRVITTNEEPAEYLTPTQTAVLDAKYAQADRELATGKGVVSPSVDDLITYLESDDD